MCVTQRARGTTVETKSNNWCCLCLSLIQRVLSFAPPSFLLSSHVHQDGVGAKIAKLLQEAGVDTFDSLAQMSSARIEGVAALWREKHPFILQKQ